LKSVSDSGSRSALPSQARRLILAERLHKIGVTRDKASGLIEAYPEEQIRRQVLFMPYRAGIKYPGAFMVKAVAEDLPAPSDEYETSQAIKRGAEVWQQAVFSRKMALYVDEMRPYVERFANENPGKIEAAKEKWVQDNIDDAKRRSLTFRPERHENEWQYLLAVKIRKKLMSIEA